MARWKSGHIIKLYLLSQFLAFSKTLWLRLIIQSPHENSSACFAFFFSRIIYRPGPRRRAVGIDINSPMEKPEKLIFTTSERVWWIGRERDSPMIIKLAGRRRNPKTSHGDPPLVNYGTALRSMSSSFGCEWELFMRFLLRSLFVAFRPVKGRHPANYYRL
jgi:hypothetical protein